MDLDESIRDFSNIFLDLFYEFPKEDMDWDLFKQNFEHLAHTYLNQFEYKPLDVHVLPNFANCETPPIL